MAQFLISKHIAHVAFAAMAILVVVLIVDIVYRRRAERRLRGSRVRFRSLVEAISDWVWEVDENGVYTYSSEHVTDLLGYSAEEVIGLSAFDLMPPKEAERVGKLFRKIGAEGKTIKSLENTLLCKNGSIRTVETNGAPILDPEGKLIGYRGMDKDITKRKRAESERLQLEAQIQHAQKLESLGVLAGGIAHDFNNLLVAILGNADLALTEMSQLSPARKSVEEIKKASIRAADLTNQMLAYSGKGKFIVKDIDINNLVEEMMHLLEVSISKKIVPRYDFAENLPTVKADAAQIRQVVMNLITNASEAIGSASGVITIATGVIEADRAYLSETYLDEDLAEGYYAYLEVSDTGCGMNELTRKKVFEPFFTTKFTGRGLGLAAVLGIVRGHGGAIKFYTEPSKGTTFKMLLPCGEHENVSYVTEDREPQEISWQGHGTILVVDDEESVRNIAKMMLEKAGLKVLTAADGGQCMKIFRQHSDEISAILLDMTMPHMDGRETYRELRKIRPDIKVILCSGYNEQDATSRFSGKGLAGFIQKPFRIQTLIQKIRQAMEKTT